MSKVVTASEVSEEQIAKLLEEGLSAGEIAKIILQEGRSPSSFRMSATEKGVPIINLARANKLNINPNSDALLTVEVVKEYLW